MTSAITSRCAEALAPLAGLRLRKVGRAGLTWFSFGEPREVLGRQGDPRIVGSHSLHVQCPFRLRDDSSVLVASHDLYADRRDPENTDVEFDWDPLGSNWFDLRVKLLNDRLEKEALLVRVVDVDPVGGFRITRDDGLVLDVMPVTSFAREHWRFFATGEGAPHFVMFEKDASRGPPPLLH